MASETSQLPPDLTRPLAFELDGKRMWLRVVNLRNVGLPLSAGDATHVVETALEADPLLVARLRRWPPLAKRLYGKPGFAREELRRMMWQGLVELVSEGRRGGRRGCR